MPSERQGCQEDKDVNNNKIICQPCLRFVYPMLSFYYKPIEICFML